MRYGLAVALFVGIGAWLLDAFSIRAPIGGIVHIETAGGPVPLYVVVFPDGTGFVQIGNRVKSRPENFMSTHEGRVIVEDFRYSPPRYRMVFPGAPGLLEMKARTDGTHGLIGRWIMTHDGNTAELPAHTTKVFNQNWFTDNESTDSPGGAWDHDGIWNLRFENDNTVQAQIEVTQWTKRDDPSRGWLDGELALLGVPNRSFFGRFEGSKAWLASFDGAVPALVTGTLQPDGSWSGEITVSDGPTRTFAAIRNGS